MTGSGAGAGGAVLVALEVAAAAAAVVGELDLDRAVETRQGAGDVSRDVEGDDDFRLALVFFQLGRFPLGIVSVFGRRFGLGLGAGPFTDGIS